MGRRWRLTEEEEESPFVELKRFDFVVQFCWKETPKSARREIAEARRLEQEQARADTASIDEQDSTEVQ